jgi:hypothetical protein
MNGAGDVRDDYLWLDEKGSVTAYINGGGFPQIVWLPQGVIATGVGASSRDEIAFADINGEYSLVEAVHMVVLDR